MVGKRDTDPEIDAEDSVRERSDIGSQPNKDTTTAL